MALAEASQRIPNTPDPSPPTSDENTPCVVCHRRWPLISHKAWAPARRPRQAGSEQSVDEARHLKDFYQQEAYDLAYTKSYAFTRALPSSVPHCVNSGRLDGFHELPVPGGGERPELHQAVYNRMYLHLPF